MEKKNGWILSTIILNATAKDVFQFAGKTMDEYGVNKFKIHPYLKESVDYEKLFCNIK